jgi:hypothetical protein
VGVYCTVLRTASCTAHLRLRHSFILPDCIYLSDILQITAYCTASCSVYNVLLEKYSQFSSSRCGVYFSFHKIIIYCRNCRLMPKAVRTLKDFTRKLWGLLCSLHFLSTQKQSTQHSMISRKRDTLDPGGRGGAACLAKAVQYALKIIQKL